MRKSILRASFAICAAILFTVLSAVTAKAAGVSFTVDTEGATVIIPTTYEVETTIKYLGDYGFLNYPQHLYIHNDFLYVADTGNNRILKMTLEGEVLMEYTSAYGVNFKNPKGIFINDDDTIWIADTNNNRVVVIDQDGEDVAVYYRPDSDLLEDSFVFAPEKIAVSSTGYIYVLKGTNLMKMDSNNEFRGYVGQAEVGFSLSRFLIRTFGTQSQVERTVKQEPAAYVNFTMSSDGYIYGVLSEWDTGQIRKLNSVGNNIFPELLYGIQIQTSSGYKNPSFSDLTILDNGVVVLCDQATGLIYEYTQEGDLLCVFGGTGVKNGLYQNAISIDHDSSGRLYVLDYTTGSITVLEPTEFISLIHNAVYYYSNGYYTEAKSYWEQVLEIDANYEMAHTGYAKVLYKEENYAEAMEQYKLGNNKDGYSDAFSEVRHSYLRQYFGWICLAIVVVAVAVCLVFNKARKYAARMNHSIQYGGDL